VVGNTDASILGFIFTVPERRLWAERVNSYMRNMESIVGGKVNRL